MTRLESRVMLTRVSPRFGEFGRALGGRSQTNGGVLETSAERMTRDDRPTVGHNCTLAAKQESSGSNIAA